MKNIKNKNMPVFKIAFFSVVFFLIGINQARAEQFNLDGGGGIGFFDIKLQQATVSPGQTLLVFTDFVYSPQNPVYQNSYYGMSVYATLDNGCVGNLGEEGMIHDDGIIQLIAPTVPGSYAVQVAASLTVHGRGSYTFSLPFTVTNGETSWLPDASGYCSGSTFTQTQSCTGQTRTANGTGAACPAGPYLNMSLSASPASGNAPISVTLNASVSGTYLDADSVYRYFNGDPAETEMSDNPILVMYPYSKSKIEFSFDCNNDGVIDNVKSVTISNPSTSQSYDCNYAAGNTQASVSARVSWQSPIFGSSWFVKSYYESHYYPINQTIDLPVTVPVDNGCAADTCTGQDCWNNLSWVPGTKICEVNGVCDPSNDGQTFSSAPTNLCAFGTASPSAPIEYSNYWTWNCLSSNGGTDDVCRADKNCEPITYELVCETDQADLCLDGACGVAKNPTCVCTSVSSICGSNIVGRDNCSAPDPAPIQCPACSPNSGWKEIAD